LQIILLQKHLTLCESFLTGASTLFQPYDPQTFGYSLIGTIVGAHGVHGWLKVQCTTDFPRDRLCTPGIRHLKAANKRAPRQVVLLQGKHRHGDEYLVQCERVDDRDTATKLRGAQLYIRDEQRNNELNADEYAVSDVVGAEVFVKCDNSLDNTMYVGIVGGIVFAEDMCSIQGLGHDYLEIILPRGIGGMKSLRDEMVLIPMVPQIVPEVDVAGQRIYIDPPPGLLDLTYVREEKTRIKGLLSPASKS
jgi:16S rRNA processing protein RimM